ncbi:MAG: cytochrome c [Candidatus Eisenbacteria bacterium]
MSAARNVGIGVTGLLVLIGILLAGVFVLSNSKMNRTYSVSAVDLTVRTDSASVARGEYLVSAVVACRDCHGEDLGGAYFMDAGAMGEIAAPNLTRGTGGVGGTYSGRDWDLALRHGVAPDGRALLFMPSEAYTHLADEEVEDIVAYLHSLPPVDREFDSPKLGPVTRMLLATGQPIQSAAYLDHEQNRPKRAPQGASLERGAHLVEVSGCRACHGADLSGGKVPGADPSWPPAANLTPHPSALGRYAEPTFEHVLRTGEKLDGGKIDPTTMPWQAYAQMEPQEIQAIWTYLQSVPEVAAK